MATSIVRLFIASMIKRENITLICKYTDLYDNDYEQKMKIYLDKERNEMVAHTDNPVFGENNLKNEK